MASFNVVMKKNRTPDTMKRHLQDQRSSARKECLHESEEDAVGEIM
jgi:hypothetical protein